MTVFEAINERAKELFVGITSLPMHELIWKHKTEKPGPISHWSNLNQVRYRGLSYGVPLDNAEAVLEGYAAEVKRGELRKGWKVVVSRTPDFV